MNGYREDHERYHKHGPSTDDMIPSLPLFAELPHRYNPRPGDTWCRTCNSAPGEFPHDDICVDCAFEDGSSQDRRTCANCDRVFGGAER